jgi:hypothetical protein
LEGSVRGPIEVLSRHLPGGTEENTKILRISGDRAEIPNEPLSNSSVEQYRHHNPLGIFTNMLATICVMQRVISQVERAEA